MNENNVSAYDDNGHGTHVAGIVGGNGVGGITTGMAPNVSLFGVKVLDSNGDGNMSNVIGGIEWSVTNGANVISMSLGTVYLWADRNCDSDSTSMTNAINHALALNITVIAAAGNYADLGISNPACISGTIAVGAVDSNDAIAYFPPNRGSSIGFPMKDHGVVAPGVNITSLKFSK